MHQEFKQYLEFLECAFEKLMAMAPVTARTLPKRAPSKCVYLFTESGRHLYVGRTWKQDLHKRMRQHTGASSQHNQAVFAFKVAREMTGRTEASYTPQGSRAMIASDPEFQAAFDSAKARIRAMELRFVEEADPIVQALLEMYVAVVLKTPYNDFETH